MGQMASSEGIFPAPEGAATLAGLKRLLKEDLVGEDETIVLLNTGSGLKYLELLD
jgi:threonine synthase